MWCTNQLSKLSCGIGLAWPRLFKGWIALSTGQISIQWILQLVSPIVIPWIMIYPVDSAIQHLNNRGLKANLNGSEIRV